MSEPTNQENNIIESVEKIFDNRRIYNIPEYQRGYKWNEEDVEALLNDIDKFEGGENKFYCLQNITIKKQQDNIYEVIDGQQRLTTLSILLSYLGETDLLNKIQYSIRKESGEFLYTLLKEKEIDYLDNNLRYNDDFYNAVKELKQENKDYDSQDVFHFCLAKHTIKIFFDKFGNDKKESFTTKLLNNVKLIVNDVSSGNDVKGETIFKNLNSNKVALEYYDLIRAIFITRVKKEYKESDIDLAEKRIKIGIDIDNMNIWWSDKNVKEYFKMFSGENNISMLYDLYWKCRNNSKSESNNNKEKSNNEALFKYLDGNTENTVFKEVVRFHNTMADWYEDKEIYHLLGFIGKHIKKIEIKKEEEKNKIEDLENIIYIWKKWEETNTTRESFKKELKKIIEDDLIKNIENENYLGAIEDPNKNWYYQENNTIKLLVLLDIIKILNNKNINHKLPANYFSVNGEDIEHIFSKTPNKQTTIKDAIENIDLIVNLVNDDKYKGELCDFVKDLEEEKKLKNEMTTLHSIGKLEKYREVIREVPCVHSIGNLVLLDSNTNRSYGNDSYIDKRRIIIELYEIGDKYIRNHTSSIFSKNVNEWTIGNIKNTAEDIRKEIEKFFGNIE
ncbi:DUF262 domain-containing protein [Brachyspira innocens]|uniref:DUF262 domain-containing protein n=1 Tax=Brachyspira innocens TaxID=13264 RepID=A0ABT8Z0V9_9SPIR|nr:DUF262 domain-containing protein [Brachyspira innocens]MDO6995051.1 DUF262 domain-containing protein [Brachyspira innocens]MDO7020780.1 DUF262 domain-containing protein [Brachyspira innocens]